MCDFQNIFISDVLTVGFPVMSEIVSYTNFIKDITKVDIHTLSI